MRRLVAAVTTVLAVGCWAVTAAGAVDGSSVIPIGLAPDAGSLTGKQLVGPVVGIASTASGNGYWLVAGDGGIFSFGDAAFYGSTGDRKLPAPVVGMRATVTGAGYWVFAADGQVYPFGDAPNLGGLGGLKLNKPVVGMVPTRSGLGYWLVASDGGVFAFGDAPFLGSTGSAPPKSPIVGLAPSPTGVGYWMLTAAGDVLPFGDAKAFGSPAGQKIPTAFVGMAATPTGLGYWIAGADGRVMPFGDASPVVTGAPRCLVQPVVGVAARPQADGVWLVTAPLAPAQTEGLAPLDQLKAESAAITALLQARQGCQPLTPKANLHFVSPLLGSRITTPFGERIHPIYKLPELHTGIDLTASTTDIRAAADGVVVDVRTRIGYGIETVIDHGGQVATLYAHQALARVKVGDTVKAGQVIGKVGATGFATGPHLHFEIRFDGVPVDPAPFVNLNAKV